VSRVTLGTLTARAVDLLEPIYKAQFEHICQGRLVTMDATPIKAGCNAPGQDAHRLLLAGLWRRG